MSEENKLRKAKEIYDKICEGLSEVQWNYTGDEENLAIECGAKGDDLPIKVFINVDQKREFVMIASPLPFEIKTDKRIDAAIAVCMVNDVLAVGSFALDITDGMLLFKITNSYVGTEPSKELYVHLLLNACHIVDDFNDKFFMLSKGMLTLDKFLEGIN